MMAAGCARCRTKVVFVGPTIFDNVRPRKIVDEENLRPFQHQKLRPTPLATMNRAATAIWRHLHQQRLQRPPLQDPRPQVGMVGINVGVPPMVVFLPAEVELRRSARQRGGCREVLTESKVVGPLMCAWDMVPGLRKRIHHVRAFWHGELKRAAIISA